MTARAYKRENHSSHLISLHLQQTTSRFISARPTSLHFISPQRASSCFILLYVSSFQFVSVHVTSSISSIFISFHLTSSTFASSNTSFELIWLICHITSSHFVSTHPNSSQFNSPHLSWSLLISAHLASFYFISPNLNSSQLIYCNLISLHLTSSSHFSAAHLTSFHFTSPNISPNLTDFLGSNMQQQCNNDCQRPLSKLTGSRSNQLIFLIWVRVSYYASFRWICVSSWHLRWSDQRLDRFNMAKKTFSLFVRSVVFCTFLENNDSQRHAATLNRRLQMRLTGNAFTAPTENQITFFRSAGALSLMGLTSGLLRYWALCIDRTSQHGSQETPSKKWNLSESISPNLCSSHFISPHLIFNSFHLTSSNNLMQSLGTADCKANIVYSKKVCHYFVVWPFIKYQSSLSLCSTKKYHPRNCHGKFMCPAMGQHPGVNFKRIF